MSGGMEALPVVLLGPLYFIAEERMEAARQEAEKRRTAAEEMRRSLICQARSRHALALRDVYMTLQQPDLVSAEETARLKAQCDKVLAALEQVATEKEMGALMQEVPALYADLNNAMMQHRQQRQRYEVQEAKRREQQLREVQYRLSLIAMADSERFDFAGRSEAQQALTGAETALAAGNSAVFDGCIAHAAQTVQFHALTVTTQHAAWLQKRAEHDHALTELKALLAGLQADPIVVRWHARALADLATRIAEAEADESAATLLPDALAHAECLVAEANAAQIKADQRDYIARGIAQSLAEMGFVVSAPQAEYPDHPATAQLLTAASAAGKSIAVSVPMEGQVWYEVDGFHQSTESAVGGGEAVVCDEAEQVLEEMHTRLEEEFQVQFSKIWWPGKDPEHRLRRADELPSGDATRRGNAR